MSIINIITENIILPLSDITLGLSVSKHLKFLLKSQWWSESDLQEYQNKKLQQLIRHAYHNVPYYNELFKSLNIKPAQIQIKEDLRKLPILTKETIRKNFPDKIVARNIPKKLLLFRSSSGSTGEPFQFFQTKSAESFNHATGIRGWYWMGYRLGDKYIKLSMNPRSSVIKKVQDKINNCSYLYSRQLVKQNFERILDEIIKIKPKFLRCYPVPLYFLSEIVKEKNLNLDFITAINTTGSTLHHHIRESIEKAFNARVYDSFSCEGGANVTQCSEGNYHSSEEYAISEFIEDNYSKSDSALTYRLITTDLHNYSVPFIRYDSQDYLVIGDEKKCKCGRELLKISSIKGRDSDVLITPANKYLIVENFVAYFEWFESVKQIQVVQDKIDEIKINLEVNELYNKNIENEILNYWQEYIGYDVKLYINVVDDIKLTPTGKRRTVIRNPNIKLGF